MGLKKQSGLFSFTLTPKAWIRKTSAIGLISKPGSYGGTYAHRDIAYEFASWISVEFKLYLIKEFQRLKDEEHKQLGWDIRRNLAKINYRIQSPRFFPAVRMRGRVFSSRSRIGKNVPEKCPAETTPTPPTKKECRLPDGILKHCCLTWTIPTSPIPGPYR